MPTVHIDPYTAGILDHAAHRAGVSPGDLVRDWARSLLSDPPRPEPGTSPEHEDGLDVHFDLHGVRTQGRFHPGTCDLRIASGPLTDQLFHSPSAAAVAVVRHYRPDLSPNRNGWKVWTVASTGQSLESVRRRS